MQQVYNGLSEEKAARVLIGLREGQTIRQFDVKPAKFDQYCAANPSYATEAQPLRATNTRAALVRKGGLSTRSHCKNGHSLKDAFIRKYRGWTIRACKICEHIRRRRGGDVSPDVVSAVKAAIERGVTINQIIHGRPVGGGARIPALRIVDAAALARYRREHPEFNRFVRDAIEQRICSTNPVQAVAAGTFKYEWHPNDYDLISKLLPDNFPDKNVIINEVVMSLLEGRLDQSQIRAKVHWFIKAQNRLFPTKFRKFGNRLLVSLDEQFFEDGSTTRGDTVTRGLWD